MRYPLTFCSRGESVWFIEKNHVDIRENPFKYACTEISFLPGFLFRLLLFSGVQRGEKSQFAGFVLGILWKQRTLRILLTISFFNKLDKSSKYTSFPSLISNGCWYLMPQKMFHIFYPCQKTTSETDFSLITSRLLFCCLVGCSQRTSVQASSCSE